MGPELCSVHTHSTLCDGKGTLEEMAAKYDDFQIVKVNVDKCRDLALRYGIEVIPTLLVLKGGQVVNRAAGLMGEPEILALVRG